MNEMTWQQVLRWEHLHRDACAMPSLLRFLGRPDDLSPRARWRSLLGGARAAAAVLALQP
jgi:cytochrome c heme-lyase